MYFAKSSASLLLVNLGTFKLTLLNSTLLTSFAILITCSWVKAFNSFKEYPKTVTVGFCFPPDVPESTSLLPCVCCCPIIWELSPSSSTVTKTALYLPSSFPDCVCFPPNDEDCLLSPS